MATRNVPTLSPAVVKLEADAAAVVDLRGGQRVLLHVGVNGLPNSCSQLSYLCRNLDRLRNVRMMYLTSSEIVKVVTL